MFKCGIIGTGAIARWHIEAIRKTNKGKVIGAASRNKAKLDTFCKEYHIHQYISYEEMLSDETIDVICICTPSGLHSDMIIKAAEAKKNIVVEKPMAITKKQCDDVIKSIKEHNVLLSVAYQSRFRDTFIKAKRVLDEGLLGKMMFADVAMKFHRLASYYSESTWKGTYLLDGGGALMNQGSHGIDILLYLMGDIDNVYANARTLKHDIEAEDTVAATVEYKNGAIGTIHASTSIYPGIPRVISIHGDKGSMIIEEDVITKFEAVDHIIPNYIEIESNDDFSASDPHAFSLDGHINVYNNTFDCFSKNQMPLVNQFEGRRSIDVICSMYESSEKKRVIYI